MEGFIALEVIFFREAIFFIELFNFIQDTFDSDADGAVIV